MRRQIFSMAVVAALGLLAGPAACQTTGLGFLGQSPGTSPLDPRDDDLEAGAPEEGALVLRVEGFDPTRDVPSPKNWKGDIDFEGAANCYALSTIATYFFHAVEWAPEAEGLPFQEWAEAEDFGRPLAMDEDALLALPSLISRSREEVARQGRVRIAGYASLVDFTREGELSREQAQEISDEHGNTVEAARARQAITDTSPTLVAFRRWVEAMQYAMQVPNESLRTVGSVGKRFLGWLPFTDFGGIDDVNEHGVEILKERLAEGRPTPIGVHADRKARGHQVLVYELRERSDVVELVTYDPNRPPRDGEARPSIVTLAKGMGWRLRFRRHDGEDIYPDYPIFTVSDPEARGSRRRFRRTAGNAEEHLERNRALGDLLGEGHSFWTRAKGGLRFVGEVLNPF